MAPTGYPELRPCLAECRALELAAPEGELAEPLTPELAEPLTLELAEPLRPEIACSPGPRRGPPETPPIRCVPQR